jgi:hypothetical protein
LGSSNNNLTAGREKYQMAKIHIGITMNIENKLLGKDS